MGKYGEWLKMKTLGDMIPDFVVEAKDSIFNKAKSLADIAKNEIDKKRKSFSLIKSAYDEVDGLMADTKDALDQVGEIVSKIDTISDQLTKTGLYTNTISGIDKYDFVATVEQALNQLMIMISENENVNDSELNAVVMLTVGPDRSALDGLKSLIPGFASHQLTLNITERLENNIQLTDVKGKPIFIDGNGNYTLEPTRQSGTNEDGTPNIINNQPKMVNWKAPKNVDVLLIHNAAQGETKMNDQNRRPKPAKVIENDIEFYAHSTVSFGVENGNYTYSISKDGFTTITDTITILDDNPIISSIQLEVGENPQTEGKYIVTFSVLDERLRPTSARVLFNGVESNTDSKGIATFELPHTSNETMNLNYSIIKSGYKHDCDLLFVARDIKKEIILTRG
ncbi:hypothetical protein [Globicatella sulfidifaciens]|uniref:Uncharacterized protein n=1 Tax=Globicatella sulfidifaciens TaxID=136093 RepID=A0A7X8C240_9LACT|nr:hypothetical protein [Globicatella sulfidifaciens]NLJ17419.1 hypothetical protein [Globicatella sulfidifaciens]